MARADSARKAGEGKETRGAGRGARATWLAGVLLFAGGLGGCANGSGGTDEVPIPPGYPDCGEPDEVEKDTGRNLNAFWSETLESKVRLCTYEPGDMIGDEEIPPFNAVSTGIDIVYYDPSLLEFLGLGGSNKLGPAAVLAHEWGHEIQVDWGRTSGLTIDLELQADCISGIFAASLSLSDPDIGGDDIAGTYLQFCLLGDPRGYPWFAPDAHGSCLQRASSFNRGFREARTTLGAGGEVDDPFAICP